MIMVFLTIVTEVQKLMDYIVNQTKLDKEAILTVGINGGSPNHATGTRLCRLLKAEVLALLKLSRSFALYFKFLGFVRSL